MRLRHVPRRLAARVEDRERIGTSVHFKALHLHPYYAERFELERGMFPEAEFISERTLSLPLSPALTEPEIDRVIEAVTESLVSGAW